MNAFTILPQEHSVISLTNLILLLDFLLPLVVYTTILIAALKSSHHQSRRVALGAILCLLTFAGGIVIRVGLMRALTATQLATWLPILGGGLNVLKLTGIALIASVALSRRAGDEDEPGTFEAPNTSIESGNPYSPL